MSHSPSPPFHNRHSCIRPGQIVRAALVVEQEPVDLRWVDICAAVDVVLAWPERFVTAFG